jgi:hypothetical protein
VLARWPAFPEVQVEFWRDPQSPYRKLVEQAFANYTAWHDKPPLLRPPAAPGMLPGDFSTVLTRGGLRLGIVGLNSAFLQLTGSNYEGKLAVDVRQLHAACDGDGPAWIKRCDFTLLMTHHPPDWLSSEAREHFFGEVVPPGRFAAHMFGHMHEHMTTSLSIGGAAARRQIQGSSLFGLESFGDGKLDRRHGYAAGRITVDDRGEASMRLWPRVAKKHAAGHWRIVQDLDAFELSDDQGTRPEPLPFARKPVPPPIAPAPTAPRRGHARRRLAGRADPRVDHLALGRQRRRLRHLLHDRRARAAAGRAVQQQLAHRPRRGGAHRAQLPRSARRAGRAVGPREVRQDLDLAVPHQLRDAAGRRRLPASSPSTSTPSTTSRAPTTPASSASSPSRSSAPSAARRTGCRRCGARTAASTRSSAASCGTTCSRWQHSRVIMALDRVDAVWGLPFKDDCFGMLRAWAQDARLGKLRLILGISTTPGRLIDRPTQSPFNLTPPIVLGDFSRAQIEQLAHLYSLTWTDKDFTTLTELVGGHPYLVRHVMHRANLAGGIASTSSSTTTPACSTTSCSATPGACRARPSCWPASVACAASPSSSSTRRSRHPPRGRRARRRGEGRPLSPALSALRAPAAMTRSAGFQVGGAVQAGALYVERGRPGAARGAAPRRVLLHPRPAADRQVEPAHPRRRRRSRPRASAASASTSPASARPPSRSTSGTTASPTTSPRRSACRTSTCSGPPTST